jgi:hypothetical protein
MGSGYCRHDVDGRSANVQVDYGCDDNTGCSVTVTGSTSVAIFISVNVALSITIAVSIAVAVSLAVTITVAVATSSLQDQRASDVRKSACWRRTDHA